MKEISTGTEDVADIHRKTIESTSGDVFGKALSMNSLITNNSIGNPPGDPPKGSPGNPIVQNFLNVNVDKKGNSSVGILNTLSQTPPGGSLPTTTSPKFATLRSIADDKGVKWHELYKANSSLSANPDAPIPEGTIIYIPAKIPKKSKNKGKKGEDEGSKDDASFRRKLPQFGLSDLEEKNKDKTKDKIEQTQTISEGTLSLEDSEKKDVDENLQMTINDKSLNVGKSKSLLEIYNEEGTLPLHAYEYGRRIAKEFQIRVKHYEKALQIFNQKLLSDGTKEGSKFNWLSLVSLGLKILLGPGGNMIISALFKGAEEILAASPTIEELVKKMGEVEHSKSFFDLGKEFAEVGLDYTKETGEQMDEGNKHFKLANLYDDTMGRISEMSDTLDRTEAPFADLTDRYYQKELAKGTPDATAFIKALDLTTNILTTQTQSAYSIDSFIQALTFEWIRLNNRPTKKRNKPRTGYLSINMDAKGDPKDWKATRVEIHAPYAEALKELLEKHGAVGSKKERVIDLSEAPIPRRYKFDVPELPNKVKAWSQGPASVFEMQSGFVGKIKGVNWSEYISAQHVAKALSENEHNKEYSLEEVKTSEDMNFLEAL